MTIPASYLSGETSRARWKRLDTAQILKRFYFCERALIVAAADWIPRIGSLDVKTALPLFCWQDAETANALRNRIFELRYPSRLLEQEGADSPLVELFGCLRQAPAAAAFITAFTDVALPALRDAYREFLRQSDPLADAPTYRFLDLALREKQEQELTFQRLGAQLGSAERSDLDTGWVREFRSQLAALGGIATEQSPPERRIIPGPGSRAWSIPDRPARDESYWSCRFYWPDIVDRDFPYGTGLRLQLRSAVSHLNEVWAVEHGGIILAAFADVLPWEWIYDAARWTYDESRHCIMGKTRLAAWGFAPAEVPLGTYIYESAAGTEPIYRLGMLYFFETKNIGRKPERTAAFKEIGDQASEHDMDFDWADETIHATYGNRWLRTLHELDSSRFPSPEVVRSTCDELVARMVEKATDQEKQLIRRQAEHLIERAGEIVRASATRGQPA